MNYVEEDGTISAGPFDAERDNLKSKIARLSDEIEGLNLLVKSKREEVEMWLEQVTARNAEVDKLKQANAELLEFVKVIAECKYLYGSAIDVAKALVAKHGGGK